MRAGQPDRAPDVAAFLDTEARRMPEAAILRMIASRWPDLTKEEYVRALDIAIELARMTLAEWGAQLTPQKTVWSEGRA